MSCEPDKTNDLSDLASQPKSVTGDQGSVTNHDLTQQIELDKYLSARNAVCSKRRLFNSIFGARYQPPSARGQ